MDGLVFDPPVAASETEADNLELIVCCGCLAGDLLMTVVLLLLLIIECVVVVRDPRFM